MPADGPNTLHIADEHLIVRIIGVVLGATVRQEVAAGLVDQQRAASLATDVGQRERGPPVPGTGESTLLPLASGEAIESSGMCTETPAAPASRDIVAGSRPFTVRAPCARAVRGRLGGGDGSRLPISSCRTRTLPGAVLAPANLRRQVQRTDRRVA